MEKKMVTNSFSKTQEAGAEFAREILASKPQENATVLALRGDLGAGKTTFLQGFAKGLGIEEVVNSPTFVVMKSFKLQALSFQNLYHIDCYRLETPEQILALGFQEIISDPKNIVAIEWPEKISNLLPKNIISINFNHSEENEREILIER
ncbi:MAG: tRNA (adenosine(37)-N6)-threonylcarbamoyltransferase complex ATPase subunit type 1 TsaE [bacterium]|nr:tRNA (adenosine(37)-N6)-threonylcarbamoyltransferase complex ATPase subunit type 1 TsaE [bacterium]